MGFQIIFTILTVFALIRLCVQFRKKSVKLSYYIAFTVIWIMVCILSWNVKYLNEIGRLLGVDRGATILVYIALSLLFYFVAICIARFYKIERDIDRIIRREAVGEFLKKYPGKKTD